MEIIWALFFIAGENVQPIDTAFRFDSRKACEAQKLTIIYEHFADQFNSDGSYTEAMNALPHASRVYWEEEKYLELKKYICIAAKS